MSTLSKLRPRVAHSQGYTDVSFALDGTRIVTVGDDARLRIVATSAILDGDEDDEDPIIRDYHKAAITCVDVRDEAIVTGSEDQSVYWSQLPDGEPRKLLLRCTLTVRHVALRPGRHGAKKSRWVAVASDELDIKLVDIDEITNIKTLKGHTRGLKSLAFDPVGDFLVSTGSDGDVNIWDLRQDQPKIARVLRGIIPISDIESREYCRMAWHPSGSHFAVPGKLGDVAMIENGTWRHMYGVKEPNRSDCITSVSWSSCGLYLASVNMNGRVNIWKPSQSRTEPLLSDQYKATITGLAWHPKQRDLCIVDGLGRMVYWENVIPAAEVDSMRIEELFDEQAAVASDEADADEQPELKAEKPTRGKPAMITDLERYNAELLADLDDDDEAPDDFVVDDDGAGYAAPLDRPGHLRRYQEEGRKRIGDELSRHYGSRRYELGGLDVQSSFQPGATPMDGDRAYLAFNMVGVIYTIDAHTHHNVNVEFHDRSQRPVHFTDYHKYRLACLGESGACFASESTTGNPSTLYYKPFDTWATNADWTVTFGDSEGVKCLAATTKGPVVATDQGNLRFFSYSGLQTMITSLPGPAVTMAANGNLLMVVYHAGGTFHGNQNLAYILYDVSSRRTVKRDPMPISSGSTLCWAAVSENGMPATYDSEGILRVLLPYNDFAWVPLLDSRATRKEKKEWYWPVDLVDDKLMCIICKGNDKHPSFPRPIIDEVPLHAPLLGMDTPAGVAEERLFRSTVLAEHFRGEAESKGEFELRESELSRKDLDIDKILLQLIMAACKGEKVQRALDLCGSLHNMKAIDGAIKIAVSNHLPALAEKMNLLKEAKLRAQTELEQRPYVAATPYTGVSAILSAMDSDARRQENRLRSVRRSDPVTPVRVVNNSTHTRIESAEEAADDRVSVVDDNPRNMSDSEEDHEEPVPAEAPDTHGARKAAGGVLAMKNPFPAIGQPNKTNSVMGGRTLFEAIRKVAPQPTKKTDDNKQTSELENPAKKRKNQTTLFGLTAKTHVRDTSLLSS
ncbi:WD40-repeat-containing domain protein [Gaertneriomyces semiglobifer]|nr:WD40-repeat-containing domain protein [Gaertneriomyces semiglobifer]